MFKIKGFSVFCLFILSLVFQPATAQNTKNDTTCYGAGQEVVDNKIPCCDGLNRMTEVGTRKVFCDQQPSESSSLFIWIMILIFPFFLLVFLIFGIRNKMAHRKNKKLNETA